MTDEILEKVAELNHKLYGPRYCKNCNQVQPVTVYKLQGSDERTFADGVYTESFTGGVVCNVCWHVVP